MMSKHEKVEDKVIHLSSVHKELDTRIFLKECSSLVKAGYNTIFIVSGGTDREENGVIIKSVPKAANRLQRIFKTTRQIYWKALSEDASIYHFHDPELIPIGLLLRLKGKKVIYDVHEDVSKQILNKYWINKYLRRFISACFSLFENITVRCFSAIVSATPQINKKFLNRGLKAVNINNYPITHELSNKTKWEDKQRVVCYLGGISIERGIYEMLEAVSKTGARLFLAGEFSPRVLYTRIIELPAWEKVEHFGYVSRRGVSDILSHSMAGLVLLHPLENYVESLPIKLFEYMAAGIPVICSDFPLWKEIVEQNKCGICVNPFDIDEISRSIQWILDNPAQAEEMGQNGRRAIERFYNWEQESIKLISLYKGILDG